MSDQYQDEKREEKQEKEVDKHEEKSAEEKWRRDPVGTVAWAIILIWAGLVFLADNLGMLSNFELGRFMPPGLEVFRPGVWPIILMGAGVILFGEVVVRMLVPAYRQPLGGTIFLAALFVTIGLVNLFGWNWSLVWPLVLIIYGLSVLVRGFGRRR